MVYLPTFTSHANQMQVLDHALSICDRNPIRFFHSINLVLLMIEKTSCISWNIIKHWQILHVNWCRISSINTWLSCLFGDFLILPTMGFMTTKSSFGTYLWNSVSHINHVAHLRLLHQITWGFFAVQIHMHWNYPPPSNSDHQDYFPINLHLRLLLGGGVDQTYAVFNPCEWISRNLYMCSHNLSERNTNYLSNDTQYMLLIEYYG